VTGAEVCNIELPAGTRGCVLESEGEGIVIELYVGEGLDREFFYCSCNANDVQSDKEILDGLNLATLAHYEGPPVMYLIVLVSIILCPFPENSMKTAAKLGNLL
jgi:hypothetical protein